MDVVWSEKFSLGQFPQHVTVADGRLFLVLADENTHRDTLRIYDETTMELLDEQLICTFTRQSNGFTFISLQWAMKNLYFSRYLKIYFAKREHL